MNLPIGTRIGPFEIVSALGVGGMGEVYRARDAKLNRDVAIKVLLPGVVADPDRIARFRREAQVLASLNHPNIAHIHGIEEADGVTALVLELVEGEDLAQRLARGPIAIDEALPIAVQIAEALEAAHDLGIIHRDLKPANIKLRPDGTVKVLDFGLAKAIDQGAASNTNAIESPTLSLHATQAGVVLGTAAYMSPEQARGRFAGKRADIWSFGCVLYEMLAGRRVFVADDVADAFAHVLTREPDWTLLPRTVPSGIVKLIRRCLEKDPKRRLADIADARLEIDDVLAGGDPTPALPDGIRLHRRTQAAWTVAAFLGVAALGLGIAITLRPAPAPTPVYHSSLIVKENLSFRATSHRFKLSPDGRRLAYVALDAGGRMMLWVRPLNSLAGQPLAGTDDATAPFWSPDSRFIAFFADQKVKRIDATGGPVTVICDAPASTGRRITPGSWNRDDVILIPSPDSSTISRVGAKGGGAPSAVTALEAGAPETQHGFPFFLPDGRRFLYVAYNDLVPLGLYVGSLDGQPSVRLMDTASNAQYASGSLLFMRGTSLLAQPFDPAKAAVIGEAVVIAENVATNITFMRAGAFSVSDTGALVYQGFGTTGTARLVSSDRAGNQTTVIDERLQYRDLSLSPDESRVAVSLANERDNTSDIWMVRASRGLRTKFTSDAATDEFSAVWSSDGADVLFSSRRKGHLDLYSKAANGASRDAIVLEDEIDKTPTSWSSDKKFILYSTSGPQTGPDIWVLPLAGDRKPFPFLDSATDERFGQFSPNGRWVAYSASESGRLEVYVAPFPGPGEKQLISSHGGSYPRWRADGTELFYHSLDNKLMAATLRTDAIRIEVEGIRSLFELRAPDGLPRNFYDVSTDGKRFMIVIPDDVASTPLSLVSNWPALVNATK